MLLILLCRPDIGLRLHLDRLFQLQRQFRSLKCREVSSGELIADNPRLYFVTAHSSIDMSHGIRQTQTHTGLVTMMAVDEDSSPRHQRIAAALALDTFFEQVLFFPGKWRD